jgi:hypothetical protein
MSVFVQANKKHACLPRKKGNTIVTLASFSRLLNHPADLWKTMTDNANGCISCSVCSYAFLPLTPKPKATCQLVKETDSLPTVRSSNNSQYLLCQQWLDLLRSHINSSDLNNYSLDSVKAVYDFLLSDGNIHHEIFNHCRSKNDTVETYRAVHTVASPFCSLGIYGACVKSLWPFDWDAAPERIRLTVIDKVKLAHTLAKHAQNAGVEKAHLAVYDAVSTHLSSHLTDITDTAVGDDQSNCQESMNLIMSRVMRLDLNAVYNHYKPRRSKCAKEPPLKKLKTVP